MSRPLLPSLFVFILFGIGARVDGASTTFWQVSTQAEFLKGEVDRVSVDRDGRVMLGPALEVLHDPASPAVWDVIVDGKGVAWAGTGNDGKVWRIDPDGKASLAYDAAELEIHAIAANPRGGVFAAASPDGKIYRVAGDGKATPFFDPEDKYIWSLVVAPDGTVYAGTGEKGRIFKVTEGGKGALFYDPETTHVTALALDPKGNVLVGTSSPARVLRLDASGRAFVLLESTYKEIRGLRVGQDGQIYVTAIGGAPPAEAPSPKPTDTTASTPVPTVTTEVTVSAIGDTPVITSTSPPTPSESRASGAQKGAVYRIEPDGAWTTVWESGDDMPYDLAVESDGSLLVATGDKGKIFRLSGNPTLTTLVTRADAQQVTAFARDGQGRLVLATSNPGRLLRVSAGASPSGSYLSDVKDTTSVATWGGIRWRGTTPPGTKIELFTRSGNTSTPDKNWSDWSRAYISATGETVESPKARFLQWKAVLTGADGRSPVLTSVTLAYLPRNTRPELESITVHPPGVVFQRPFPTGEPELAGLETPLSDSRPIPPSASASQPSPVLGRRSFQKSLQTLVWRASDADQDRLQFDVLYRQEGETGWKVLKRAMADEIYTWDTTSVPDGTYVVKVVASDSPSNAPDVALSGERESQTFDVDNTPPTITVPAQAKAAAGMVSFSVKDGHSPVHRVEYSQNAGRWRVAFPVDGLLDSREEHFQLKLDPELGGPVVLRVTDTLGNVATAVLDRPTGGQ